MGSVHFSNYNSADLGIPSTEVGIASTDISIASTDIGIPLPTLVYLYRHWYVLYRHPIGNGDNFIFLLLADPLPMRTDGWWISAQYAYKHCRLMTDGFCAF